MAQQAEKLIRNINLWIIVHGIEECGRTISALRYKLRIFGVLIYGTTDMFCDNKDVYKNASTPESQLHEKHHSISYHMAWEAVESGSCRIAKEDTSTNLEDLFTKVLPMPRREYILNKFTYWEFRMNDNSIISGDINGHPGDYTIKLTIIEYSILSDRGGPVNPVRIESCESLWTSAEALMRKCVEITD